MAQFDVYRNPEHATRDRVPLIVDVQSDLLADLATRLVAPLYRADLSKFDAPRRLCPSFVVGGLEVTMFPHQMAGVPTKVLGRRVGTLVERRDDIVDAIDAVVSGV